MYQSSNRTNFLDILADPTAIALLGSIALHALIGASLPFFPQPQDIKKAEPGTVKVVELTPSELQRIPQAPPIPAPQVLTPVIPPTIPSTTVTPPASNPPIAPNSPVIPFSPIRIPLENANPKPAAGNKQQQAIPQKQPTAPTFDPNISLKPTSKPIVKPTTKNTTPKPLPVPKPAPVPAIPKKSTNPDSPETTVIDPGGETPPTTSGNTPNQQATSPTNSNPTAGTTSPQGTPPAQSSGIPGGGGTKFPYFYGMHDAAARERLNQYRNSHPGIKEYTPQLSSQKYPVVAPCRQIKQTPFLIVMVAFGPVPENTENNPLGDSTAPPIDKPFVVGDLNTPENDKLTDIAVKKALEQSIEDDKKRPVEDKGKKVLYQYRVQFDPTTCKR